MPLDDQNHDLQMDALIKAGWIFANQSVAQLLSNVKGVAQAVAAVGRGGLLAVGKLSRVVKKDGRA